MSAASILHSPIHLQTESCILWLLCCFVRKLPFSLFLPNSLIWPFSHWFNQTWLTKLKSILTELMLNFEETFVTGTSALPVANTNLFQLLIHFRDTQSAYFRVFVHYYSVSFPFLKCFPPKSYVFFRPQTLRRKNQPTNQNKQTNKNQPKKTPTGNKCSNSISGKTQAIEMKRRTIPLSVKFAQFYL